MKADTELAKLYAVVTQGFITILVLIGIGMFIGYKIDHGFSTWAVVLGVIGALCGIVSLIAMLFKLNIGGDSNGRKP